MDLFACTANGSEIDVVFGVYCRETVGDRSDDAILLLLAD